MRTWSAPGRAWRSAFGVAMWTALLPLAAHAGGVPRVLIQHPPVVLLEQPVRVEATLADDGSGLYAGTVAVSRGERRFDLRTIVMTDSGYAAAVAQLRGSVGWKDRYLFVATSCGSGNAWKCASEAVFTLKAGELVGLGSLLAREGAGYGSSWRGGAFHDVHTDVEFSDLTSHAMSPRLELLLRERDGRLVGDADSTWALHAERFALNDSLARARTEPEVVGYRRTWEFAIAPRLENAVLAKWCGRTVALDSVLAEARRTLPAQTMVRFDELLSRVEPGALPKRSRLASSGGH